MKRYILNLFLLVVAIALPLTMTQANVNLVSDQASYTVNFGNPFTVKISLQITGTEQVSGTDYYLNQATSAGFAITGRSETGGHWSGPEMYFSDAQVTSSADNQLPAGPDNALNPRNDFDLAGSNSDPTTFLTSPGTYLLSTFTISTVGVTAGTYTLFTNSNPNEGWVDNSFNNNVFSNHALFTVTVQAVPEPATLSLFALGGVASVGMTILRRRRA